MKITPLLILVVSVCGAIYAADRDHPVPTKRVPPVYTREILAKHLSGVVVLDFYVEEDGTVKEAKAAKSPAPELSEAAIACIKQWKFLPMTLNGKPVRCHMSLPLDFGSR
jgi:TonB family protein